MAKDEQVIVNDEKSTPAYESKTGVNDSASDPEFTAIHAQSPEATKRGLKARHAQMIALGGTIGMACSLYSQA